MSTSERVKVGCECHLYPTQICDRCQNLVIFVRFADNGNIRKWDRKPFDGATRFEAVIADATPRARRKGTA